jgi:hypothetical protein
LADVCLFFGSLEKEKVWVVGPLGKQVVLEKHGFGDSDF